jgi:glycosyltransferase involved in cell wall biosynthesis
LKLTIVIPCRDDAQVVRCVRSVDADAEILIVLNGSPPGFVERLRRELGARVRIEILESANLPRALEHGIHAASFDRVLLMDSDCVFEPGSVVAVERAFDAGASDAEVYKGRIVFDPGSRRSSALVARSRSQRMARIETAYKPPLALSRRLQDRLGGYFFDSRLIWKEDADLDYRVRRAGIRIGPVEGCVIHHAPLSVRADLNSSFRYGVGAAIAEHLEIPLLKPFRSVNESLQRHGPDAALYMIVLNLLHRAGYTYGRARLRLSGERWLEQLYAHAIGLRTE